MPEVKDCCAVARPVYAERLDPALIFLWLLSLHQGKESDKTVLAEKTDNK
jgi:hypothetical protein